MFIKLSFSSDQTSQSVFRILADIINTPSVDSASALSARMISASYHPDLTTGYVEADSEIIRTVGLTTTKAHIASFATTPAPKYQFTLEFKSYDAEQYYYVQARETGSGGSSVIRLGTGLSGGDMNSAQRPLTVANSAASDYGTDLTPTGANAYTTAGGRGWTTSANFNKFRTVWVYITDKCIMLAFTFTNSFRSGFPSSLNSAASYGGPFVYSQYTRYDYHNNASNGIVPLFLTNPTAGAAGSGFGSAATEWTQIWNSSTTAFPLTTPYTIYNAVSAASQVGSNWSVISTPNIIHGAGNRFCDAVALASTALNTSSGVGLSKGLIFNTTVGARYPSADLKSVGFAMHPITWRNNFIGAAGGNVSAQGGIYWFNGDYFPGDEFTYNAKTYKIFAPFVNFSDRIGLAVPKE
jgi:hypothetical protein